jgi:hypothetical protein
MASELWFADGRSASVIAVAENCGEIGAKPKALKLAVLKVEFVGTTRNLM